MTQTNALRALIVDLMAEVFGLTTTLNDTSLPGSPDFSLRDLKLAIFVRACFSDGCRLHCNVPKTNRKFWQHNLSHDLADDVRIRRKLNRMGWSVIAIWEHEIRSPAVLTRRLEKRREEARKRWLTGSHCISE